MITALCLVALTTAVGYTDGFGEGDWVTYEEFRYITSVAMDQTIVYFGTTGGVIRYDTFAKRWLAPLTVTDGIPNERIDEIAYDPNTDRLWVLTPSGAAYYQPTFKDWYRGGEFPRDLIRNDFDPSAYPLLTTEFGYSYQEGYVSDHYLRKYPLTRGVEDGFNHLYVGTWGIGPAMINTRYRDLNLIPYGPYSSNVSAIVRVGDQFWIGSGPGASDSDAGLSVFDTQAQQWRWYLPRFVDGLASAWLTSAVGDGESVWFGTSYGLVRYDQANDRFATLADFSQLPSVTVTSLAEDSLWIFAGTDQGLGYIKRQDRGQVTKKKGKQGDDKKSSKSNSSLAIAPQSPKMRLQGWRVNKVTIIENYLYVATDRGVLRRRLDNDLDFEFVDTPRRMLSTEVFDIEQGGDSLYFATERDVVVVALKSGEVAIVTDPSYFDRWRIRDIAVDGQNLWGATDMGLWKYSLKDGHSRLFTASDGMVSDDVRSIEILGDFVWIATPRGLIRFFWNDPGRAD